MTVLFCGMAFFCYFIFLVEKFCVLSIFELLVHFLYLFSYCWLVLYVHTTNQNHQTFDITLRRKLFEHRYVFTQQIDQDGTVIPQDFTLPDHQQELALTTLSDHLPEEIMQIYLLGQVNTILMRQIHQDLILTDGI